MLVMSDKGWHLSCLIQQANALSTLVLSLCVLCEPFIARDVLLEEISNIELVG